VEGGGRARTECFLDLPLPQLEQLKTLRVRIVCVDTGGAWVHACSLGSVLLG
jgi:hypothetical protein